ncbi:LamG-like jellyroll fold domain-containing protein [Bacteroides sp. OF04-15BH]|uniref:LamG-like jellyroll fold domain-containing protein n=1 Tax=Bacteroides sp. OF04-15BH TaxID=2292281 RepID=UPI000E4FC45E|nr:LamG-like jellyroll fold domain-containing protein [Bacteroides sp. OF04-15BH]RHP65781.1 T9SS C-terminal target domain-containing protein [Bacteroides sp. OF04-15BH]
MRKRTIPLFLLVPAVAWSIAGNLSDDHLTAIKNKLNSIPDSMFSSVKKEDLLKDEVYMKLARDGWSQDEIKSIFGDYLKRNKSKVRGSLEYGRYAKQWLPTYGYTPGGDTIYQFADTAYNENMMRAVKSYARTKEGNDFNGYYLSEEYSPEPRLRGERQPGVFRPAKPKPSSGRIHWIQVHPTDPDKLMVIPDGSGICRTDDGGKHWELITDRIPERYHRNTATHSAIPVDPDDWDHLFAFMSNGNPVYETMDGGKTWTRVEGATHKGFKRGHAFRDSEGTLKFIGAVQNGGNNYWSSELWISENKGVTWNRVQIPDSLIDVRPENNVKGAWFQETAFHPKNRDLIFFPTSRAIYYFDNGGRPEVVNGVKKYVLKKLHFKVYNADSTQLRCEGYNFPFEATTQAFLNINPNNPNEMWFATGSRNVSFGSYSALYRSRDGGKTWITLQEPYHGIGSGRIYGNECPWGWLGGFGVNYADTRYLYGCSMSSGYSEDGGVNFREYAWGNRLKSLQADGNYYHVTNSRHNADNHAIVSHASGRVFRASDSGILMKDKNINNHEWTNIGGDMGQMLFYCIRVNEFGDQMMHGNTQDIDVQTYREGRWGNWRGYEGSTAFINPYSNMGYYPSGGGGIDGLDYGSWVGHDVKADVCTGNWYVQQNEKLFIIEDFGKKSRRVKIQSATGEDQNVNSYVLSRNNPSNDGSTVWVRTGGSWFRYSHDNGNTFTYAYQVANLNNVQTFAADPNNWTKLYIVAKSGSDSKIYLCDMVKKTILQDLTYNLPKNMTCNSLFLHEGSGDLYFYNSSTGIFILENGSTEWKFWMKGYNAAKSGSVIINYTTQEMVLHDYGRGIYVADLENPSDRYFDDGFQLKALSCNSGRLTLGINTHWTIPFYYNYVWTVNGVDVNNPYQYLTHSLKAGDKVQLKLTLRESPDVSTLSEVYVVKDSDLNGSVATRQSKTADSRPKALYSDGNGRVDLGYVDLFLNDFSIDLWVCPESSTGVILANGQKVQTRDGRGWWLGLDNGILKFNYVPTNRFDQPTYETRADQERTLQAGTLPLKKWSHVVLTQERNGSISIYVNGVKKVTGERILPKHSLNNALYLSLFADGYEQAPLTGTVDELKIWKYSMSEADVRKAMNSQITSNTDALVYYNSFDADKLEDNKEAFSQVAPHSRILARTKAMLSPVAGKAETVERGIPASGGWIGDEAVAKVSLKGANDQAFASSDLYAYSFRHNFLEDTLSNLNSKYYTVAPYAYILRDFAATDLTQKVNIIFRKNDNMKSTEYRLYSAAADAPSSYWTEIAKLQINSDGNYEAEGLTLQQILNNKLIIVSLDNGIEIIPDEGSNMKAGKVTVTESGYTEVPFTAYLRGGNEPEDECRLKASSAAVRFDGPLNFVQGKATGKIIIDSDKLDDLTSNIVSISSDDAPVVPFSFAISDQRISNYERNAVRGNWGGFYVGDASTFSSLNSSNTMTFMTWIRIEDKSVLEKLVGLMMFRSSSGATGLHIDRGNVRCHWNEESWSWSTASDLNITASDLGRWIHIAMVARPDGMDYYLNGRKFTIARGMSRTRIASEMMLGMTVSGEKYFKGSFDQLMVWNRSLTQDEVLHYMHHPVELGNNGLIAYANMDAKDSNGMPVELVSGKSFRTNGGTELTVLSEIPYNPAYSVAHTSVDDKACIHVSSNGSPVDYALNVFKDYSYNYIQNARSLELPLTKESYSLVPLNSVAYGESDVLKLDYTSAILASGDPVRLAIRPLGSLEPYTMFYESVADTDGHVSFEIPAQSIQGAVEVMFFSTQSVSERPIKASLSLYDKEQRPANAFVLHDEEKEIHFDVTLRSGNPSVKVPVYIKETSYAKALTDSVDLSVKNPRVTVVLDYDQLNKLAWNPVTVNLLGVDSEPVELNVALEPKVRLSVAGTEKTLHNASSSVPTYPVKVELVQGILDEDVKLEVVSDVPGVVNGMAGVMFNNTNVKYSDLKFFGVENHLDDGWNLVGNPYLASINVTKNQNYNATNIARYVYHYDNITRNYVVSDMVTFEPEKLINPFSAYFVQAMASDAHFELTPISKSRAINRKVLDYDVAAEQVALTMQLCEDGQPLDELKFMWENGASADCVFNEDALKMWSLSEDAMQIYSYDKIKKAMAVNTLPLSSIEAPLAISAGHTGKMTLKVKRKTGFTGSDRVLLVDKFKGNSIELGDGTEYEFDVDKKGAITSRFSIRFVKGTTGIAENTVGYPVIVRNGKCIISGLKGNADIRIFDMAGRMVVSEHTSDAEYSVRLNTGYYLVKIKENGKEFVTKISMK